MFDKFKQAGRALFLHRDSSPRDKPSRVCIASSGLVVNGSNFRIRGVTYAGTPKEEDLKLMSEMGVNAIRIWNVDDSTGYLLDLAHKYNIKLLAGIWMRHGRPGQEGDDDFDWINDEAGKQEQMYAALKAVKKHKDHPAMLMWAVGNEVTLNIATHEEKVSYANFLEQVCSAIKTLDSSHPVASISAWLLDVPYWVEYCKSVDLYGINVYGHAAYSVSHELKKYDATKFYFLGEFGPVGEWDAAADSNGIKIEPNDFEKYEIFANNWNAIERNSGEKFLGGFLFNFGNQLDYAGIWLNFFIGRSYRPGYWGARKAFQGNDPPHPIPVIKEFSINKSCSPLRINSWVDVKLLSTTSRADVSFHYNCREQGSRVERNAVKLLEHQTKSEDVYQIKLPNIKGTIKVYAFVRDEYSNLAITSLSLKLDS